jgi:hypothetical protein
MLRQGSTAYGTLIAAPSSPFLRVQRSSVPKALEQGGEAGLGDAPHPEG